MVHGQRYYHAISHHNVAQNDHDITGEGYFQLQSTKPQTLGYSLADSPAGLLAWIYEKLVNWTDDYSWEDDEHQQKVGINVR